MAAAAQSDSTALLEMRGISRQFPGVVALERVDFSLRAGEVHVLLGENGAGKSTLVRILCGACRRDSGTILLQGVEREIPSPRRARALGISAIHQEFSLVPQLSAACNVLLGSEPQRWGVISNALLRQQASRFLDMAGADFSPHRLVSSLNVGRQQLVEIARALAVESQVLIMDEPTAALSAGEISRLFETIRRLKARGVGVIYISHRLEEIPAIGDRVTVLRDGHRVTTCPARELSPRDMVRLMVGRDLKEHYPKVQVRPGPPLLELSGVCGREVRDIDLTVRRGEVVGLAGLMGAGRTALARLLFGLEPECEGKIRVRGRPVRLTSPLAAIRCGIGLLTEDRKREGLLLGQSVARNISLASLARISRWGVVDGKAEGELAARFVRQLRIRTTGTGQVVSALSGGNQQKVVLSRWLACGTQILIFDEPTRGIDVAAKVEIYRVINRLVEKGAGILMISSELAEIVGLSDRVLVMRAGRLQARFRRGEVDQEGILAAALGRPPGEGRDAV